MGPSPSNEEHIFAQSVLKDKSSIMSLSGILRVEIIVLWVAFIAKCSVWISINHTDPVFSLTGAYKVFHWFECFCQSMIFAPMSLLVLQSMNGISFKWNRYIFTITVNCYDCWWLNHMTSLSTQQLKKQTSTATVFKITEIPTRYFFYKWLPGRVWTKDSNQSSPSLKTWCREPLTNFA